MNSITILKFRTKITLFISFIVFLGFTGTALIFTRYSVKVKEEEILFQQKSLSEKIISRFDTMIQIPESINTINSSFTSIMGTDPDNLEKLHKLFVYELKENPLAGIIALGLENGSYIEAQQLEDNSIRIGERNESTGGALEIWTVDKNFNKSKLENRVEDYDHRKRPWYQKGEGWSDVYFYSSNHHPAVSYNRYITDKKGNHLGVLTTTISLDSLNTFLDRISISPNSKIIVTDSKGYLVGTSFHHAITDSRGMRLKATETVNDNVNRIAEHFLDTGEKSFTYLSRNGLIMVKVVPLSYKSGLLWNIFIMTPEKDFTKGLDRFSCQNTLFLLLIFILSIGIVFLTSRNITKPIKFIAEYVSRIAYGSPVKSMEGIPGSIKTSSKEIKLLSDNLEIMSSRLNSAFSIIEESRKEYKELVENINTIIMKITPDGTITYCNPYGLNFYGYTEEELIGKTVQETVLRGVGEQPLSILKNIFSKNEKYWNGENKNVTKSGQTVWILWSNHLIYNDKNEAVELLSTGQDITKRKETKEKMAAYLKKNSILLSEIHHRVKNNLQIIISIINLQIGSINNPELETILQGLKTRIQSMALVHEMLYSSSSFSEIGLHQYVQSLSNDISQTFRDENKMINIRVSSTPVFVELSQAITVGLILSELISNAVKYAFEGRDSGDIMILLKETENEMIEITVKDNGIGISKSQKGNSGLGTVLIEALTQQLGAEIKKEESDGFSFRFTFKASRREI